MAGWISLPRDIVYEWIWEDPVRSQRWLELVMMASWEDTPYLSKNRLIQLKRGQFAITIRKLMLRWQTYSDDVTKFLKLLESEGMITRDTSNKFTIITIVEYDRYSPQNIGDFQLGYELNQEQKSVHNKKLNNKKNNNSSNTHACETNFFWDKLEATPLFIENCCMALKCDSAQVEQLLVDFKNEMRAVEYVHTNMSDCKHHFIKWSKSELQKLENNERNKTSVGSNGARDKYAGRRGKEPPLPGGEDDLKF